MSRIYKEPKAGDIFIYKWVPKPNVVTHLAISRHQTSNNKVLVARVKSLPGGRVQLRNGMRISVPLNHLWMTVDVEKNSYGDLVSK